MAETQTPSTPTPTDPSTLDPQPSAVDEKAITDEFKSRLESAARNNKDRRNEWKRNVEIRLGRPPEVTPTSVIGMALEDDIQSEINPDWSLTKTKTANLYSQVPTVQGTHENKQYAPAVPLFMKALNYELGEKRANVGVAMEEVLNDCVNAAGVGAVIVGYAARFETVDMPQETTIQSAGGPIPVKSLPPNALKQAVALGLVHMVPTQRLVSDKFYTTRIPITDLRWPTEFLGSNFDDADWLGHKTRWSWAEALSELKPTQQSRGITAADKDKILGSKENGTLNDLRSYPDRQGVAEVKQVTGDVIYYWRHKVDPEEKDFKAIWKLVFIDGLDEPAIHEPWKGQQRDPQTGKYVGACKFPIRVLTLTYVSDNPIPPSDSQAGRPQVNDLRRSRSQMFQNRERSIPMRGFDVNRVDPLIQDALMRGHYQGMIPFNGRGQDAMWEVARASYPSEDFSFDAMTKADLMESWQIGPNQAGTMGTGEKPTKAEVQTTQANFATRIGQERARVAYFFLGIAEVVAGLMALYSDFPTLTDQERQTMDAAWNHKHILHDLVLKIRPDSTVMLDTQTRYQRLANFLNLVAKSGLINPAPLIVEMAELSGLDPAEIMKPPQPPPPPDPPTLSLRGKDDLTNPMVMALLVKSKQAPEPADIQKAVELLTAAQDAVVNPKPPAPPAPGAPGQPPGQPAPYPQGHEPVPPPEAHPGWNSASKIIKRSRDMNG